MKTVTCTLILLLVSAGLSLDGQNRFMMIPPVINLDATGGAAEGHLHTTLEPVAWTITESAEWLIIEPLSGTGATNLVCMADPNPGPRRMTTILIRSVDGSVPPLAVEVRQYQMLPPGRLEMSFNRIEYVSPPPDPMMPGTGMVNLSFEPFPEQACFSLLGRTAPGQPPVWLVRNAWMPPAYLKQARQSFSHLFNLDLPGLDPTVPVNQLQFAWTLSNDPDTLMPWVPESAWILAPLVPDFFIANGRPEGVPVGAPSKPEFWPVAALPWNIGHVVYIGCDMPNGDLDGSSSEGYDLNGCGPAAAANSLKWLDKEHPRVNVPGSWRDAFEQLGTLMNRDSGQTVNDDDFIRAKLDFIEMYDLPIKVKYQASTVEGDVDSSSGNSSADDQDGDEANQPQKDWMVKELEDGEDVEVGVGFARGGHWVVATGTITINGQTYLFYKHDIDQSKPDSTKQQGSPVNEVGGVMSLPSLRNGKIEIVVSESYDPEHVPAPSTERFDQYCQSFKRTIPPRSSITITYPENPDRCFNTTVRVLNRAESDSYVNAETWNFNSGKTRTWHNNTGQPVTVEVHNDDHYDGGEPLKSYRWYEVVVNKLFEHAGGVTDPGNEERYAGFSIGTSDGSAEEFGMINDREVQYIHRYGSRLKDFPAGMATGGVEKVSIRYPVPGWNRYWNNLGLWIGIAAVAQPVSLIVECPSTGFADTLEIEEKGKKFVQLGESGVVSFFDISMRIEGSGAFLFDNVGVPSLVQMEPSINTEPGWLLLSGAQPGDTAFRILNPGGSDLRWSLSHRANWFTVNPMNGLNESEVLMQYQANTGSPRQDTLTITAPGARNTPYYLVVKQDSAASWIHNPELESLRAIIWPNPNQGEFELTIRGVKPGMVDIRILDYTGREVWRERKPVSAQVLSTRLALPALSGGIYFIEIGTKAGRLTEKLIISRTPGN